MCVVSGSPRGQGHSCLETVTAAGWSNAMHARGLTGGLVLLQHAGVNLDSFGLDAALPLHFQDHCTDGNVRRTQRHPRPIVPSHTRTQPRARVLPHEAIATVLTQNRLCRVIEPREGRPALCLQFADSCADGLVNLGRQLLDVQQGLPPRCKLRSKEGSLIGTVRHRVPTRTIV